MSKSKHTPGEAWEDVRRENAAPSTAKRCDCGHLRMTHDGATSRNDGGNECRACDCPLYTEAA
jgi:hypothetical protein